MKNCNAPDLPCTVRHRHGSAVPRPQHGFAMIEALIAILIFSLAVLGLVGLQVSMSRAQTGAKFRADAAFLANDLVGTIWADAANRGAYLSSNCAVYTPCHQWETRLHAALPGSTHNIVPDVGSGLVTITINWTVPTEGVHQLVTATTITPN